jgi:maltodextrin utilization protein YvdJ
MFLFSEKLHCTWKYVYMSSFAKSHTLRRNSLAVPSLIKIIILIFLYPKIMVYKAFNC